MPCRSAAERLAHPAAAVLLAAALLLAAAVPLHAQRTVVSGRVTDSTGAPLAGANVVVTGTLLGAATAADGTFTIRNVHAGPVVLRATMLGYDAAEVRVTAEGARTDAPVIVLREVAITTDEIVVTAGRRPQSLEEVPVSMAVFDAKDISRRTLITLDQALRYVPGVNMTESQINIRGSSGYSRAVGTRVLMLLDGVPLLAGDANEIKYDAIPMYLVDRIEVVKGAGSALYGSSALGGVVNVITRSPDGPSLRARAYTGFWDNPQYREWKWWGASPRYFNGLDLQHGGSTGALDYLVSAGVRNDQAYRKNDDYVRWNAFGKASYKLGSDRVLGMTVNVANDDRGNWVFWRDLAHAMQQPAGADPTERVISKKMQATLSYRETLSERFTWSARGTWYRTAYDTHSDTSDYSLRPSDRVQSTSDVFMGDVQGTFVPVTDLIMTGGIEGSATSVDARIYGQRTASTGAAYLQNDYKAAPGLDLSAGVRVDYTRIDTADGDGQINPRIGAAWSPVHGTVVRASYGWGFRSPSIAERFATASAGGLRTKPNPGLLPERSTSYEIGCRQELPLPAVLDAAVFLTDYDNLVEPKIDTDGRIVFRNITRARITGAEVGVMTSLLDRLLEVGAGWTYMDPRDRNLHAVLKYRPRHLLYGSATLNHGMFSLGADVRWISRVEAIDEELSIAIQNGDERVATFVTDARLTADLRAIALPLTATFAVNNLFQYNYVEIVGNLAPIRNFRLTVEAAF